MQLVIFARGDGHQHVVNGPSRAFCCQSYGQTRRYPSAFASARCPIAAAFRGSSRIAVVGVTDSNSLSQWP